MSGNNKSILDKSSIMKNWSKEITKSPVLYPDERLTAFLKAYASNNSETQKKAIDIGFGSGRHLKLLNDLGFDTYGIDVLEEAKELVQKNFTEFPTDKIIIGDFNEIEILEKFDVIVLWGSIFLVPFSKISDSLLKIKKILAKDGRIFLNFRTNSNWFFGLGKEIEKNTFLLDERANEYNGFLYAFVNEAELKNIIADAGFTLQKIEKIDLYKKNLSELNSWFICELAKQ
jgi:2-polyprenyl-3-methyl-5-hydroxy-6-metoxy-1,4-benzoquinol methylase